MENDVLSSITEIRFNSYKSFKSESQFNVPFNKDIILLIGRNNSGKSSIIDVIELLFDQKHRKSFNPVTSLSLLLDLDHIREGFREGYYVEGVSLLTYGSGFVGEKIDIDFDGRDYVLNPNQKLFPVGEAKKYSNEWSQVVSAYTNEFDQVSVFRLNAERDIVPEKDKDIDSVNSNGSGATNLIRRYINLDDYDENRVEQTVLQELNKIMDVDAHFDSIRIQQVVKNTENGSEFFWEIFLVEKGQRYALSKSGSGLKTIILILIYLYLLPTLKQYKDKKFIFAFEEIENNLHPALQRRIFDYLNEFAIKNNTKIIISSHSNVAINTFYGKSNATICHVIKNDGKSSIQEIGNSEERGQLLSDLGVKASDLFQTNGIIWVEGPSDRIYILRWIDVFVKDFSYSEGSDFQFLYYGGRLLAHYEASDVESKTKGLINVLLTNRNSAIVIDSDKKAPQTPINDTKKRIVREFEEHGLFSWVTKGKEIENYVSAEAVNSVYNSNLSQIGRFELFPDYIKKYYTSFSGNKVDAARKLSEFITSENSSNIMDLKDKILELCYKIREWNN